MLEGREAVAACRTLMGVTDGAKAAPGTVRGDFGLSVQNNLVHGSDSPENAAAEIALWFTPGRAGRVHGGGRDLGGVTERGPVRAASVSWSGFGVVNLPAPNPDQLTLAARPTPSPPAPASGCWR